MNSFSFVMHLLLTLASHDADGIVNGRISFCYLKIIKMKCNMNFWSCDATGTVLASQEALLNSLCQDNQMRCNMTVLVL